MKAVPALAAPKGFWPSHRFGIWKCTGKNKMCCRFKWALMLPWSLSESCVVEKSWTVQLFHRYFYLQSLMFLIHLVIFPQHRSDDATYFFKNLQGLPIALRSRTTEVLHLPGLALKPHAELLPPPIHFLCPYTVNSSLFLKHVEPFQSAEFWKPLHMLCLLFNLSFLIFAWQTPFTTWLKYCLSCNIPTLFLSIISRVTSSTVLCSNIY